MNDLFKSVFLQTFPPRILASIIRMVDDGEISRTTGKLLLEAYVSAHGRMLMSPSDLKNPVSTLNEELDRVGLIAKAKEWKDD